MIVRFARVGGFACALSLAGLVAGCVVQERRPAVEIVAPKPPPPVRYEVIPPPPRPAEFVEWRPGHWHWDGREYVWMGGEYIERPHPRAAWSAGHWEVRGDRWAWVEGRWR
jgi:hypothetical protein